MTEYSVLFVMKLSAKNVKDLERKAEASAEAMSKCLRKPVYAWQYGEIEKQDSVQSTLTNSDD